MPKRWKGKRRQTPEVSVDTREVPEVPRDTGQAKIIRKEAEAEMRQLREQAPLVSYLTNKLVERRKANHFGDELTVTFRPRRHLR